MKFRRFLLFLALMACALPVSAQQLEYGGLGPRGGVSSDPDQGFLGVHFNFGEFAPHLRFQPSLEVATGDDYDILSANFPAHYRFSPAANIVPYVGGGVVAAFVDYDPPNRRSDSDFEIGFKAIGGIEWPLRNNNDFFLEVNIGFGDIQDAQILAGWMFGFGSGTTTSP